MLFDSIAIIIGSLEITAPGIVPPCLQIVKVALVGIGFALKRDVAVGIAPHGQPHQPLDQISQIKKHEQHLALLSGVDAFMVHQFVAQVHAMVHKKYPQQVDCREAIERQYGGAHDLHRHKGTTFFLIHIPHSRSRAITRRDAPWHAPQRNNWANCPSCIAEMSLRHYHMDIYLSLATHSEKCSKNSPITTK